MRDGGWVQLRTDVRKEISPKRQLEARKKRREWIEIWSIRMGQLERVYSEQMGVAK